MLLATLGDDPAVVPRSHTALSESLVCEEVALLPRSRCSSQGCGEEEEETSNGQARAHVPLPANCRRASVSPELRPPVSPPAIGLNRRDISADSGRGGG